MTPRRIEYPARYFRRLEDIRERIADDNPAAAARVVQRIRTAVERLAGSPGIGRPGWITGTGELVIAGTPYIVPFRVKGDLVQVNYRAPRRPEMARPASVKSTSGTAMPAHAAASWRGRQIERWAMRATGVLRLA